MMPKSMAGRIMAVSWSMWCLLTITAYTASLASFLVARVSQSLVKPQGCLTRGKHREKAKPSCLPQNPVSISCRRSVPTQMSVHAAILSRAGFPKHRARTLLYFMTHACLVGRTQASEFLCSMFVVVPWADQDSENVL